MESGKDFKRNQIGDKDNRDQNDTYKKRRQREYGVD